MKCWPTIAAWHCIGKRRKLRTTGRSRSGCGGNWLIFSKFASGEHRGNQPNPLIFSETSI
ncbi:hypothetical protein HIM51_003753 [Escherichia coli]|nr:hypothetical protein [Escherichia coli]EFI3836420.1 hypothetical protein [Escherichia coli]EFI8569732.1 hypothetical protein [Escherichia coli]EFJ3955817.1 hypothetical protein [Escherichia coli]EFJ4017126.1 hypothetical protein [Escherichia coli]